MSARNTLVGLFWPLALLMVPVLAPAVALAQSPATTAATPAPAGPAAAPKADAGAAGATPAAAPGGNQAAKPGADKAGADKVAADKAAADKAGSDKPAAGSGDTATPRNTATRAEPVSIPADFRFFTVLLVIGLMGGLFYVLFRWQHQIEQSAFFSGIYTDAVKRVEVMRMAGPTLDKWQRGDYLKEIFLDRSERGRAWIQDRHPRPVFDPDLLATARALGLDWEIERLKRSMAEVREVPDGSSVNPFARDWGSAGAAMRSSKPAGTMSEPAEAGAAVANDEQRCRKALAEFDAAVQQWVRLATGRALDWYQDDFAAVERAAADRAKLVLNVDFSALRGRGPEFVLEFTAVVVIIFAAVILGVLGVLDSNQIGTLLAAIAGYVLGKGTSRGGTAAGGNPAPAGGAGAPAGGAAGPAGAGGAGRAG